MLGFGKISKAPINDKIPTFKCHTSITILEDLDRPRIDRRTAMLFSHQISAKFPLPLTNTNTMIQRMTITRQFFSKS